MRSALLTFLVLLPGLAQAQIPVLNVSTTRLTFITSGTGQFPPSQQVRIRNIGSGALTWRASASVPWIKVTPFDGSAPSTLTVTVDTTGLAVGDYNGRVTVAAVGDADDSPAYIAVVLNLVAPAKPAADQATPAPPPPETSPPQSQARAAGQPAGAGGSQAAGGAASAPAGDMSGSIRLTAPIGSRTPVSSVVEIGAPPGRGAMSWTARSDQPWLTVEPQRGTTPSSAAIKASPGNLPAGTQRATVTFVDGTGAVLLVVPVVLSVGADAGDPGALGGSGLTVPPTLPPATRNLPYSQAIPVKGGTPPYNMQILQGRLPPGMRLMNGAISGVSTTPGNYAFVLGISDSARPPRTTTAQMLIRVIPVMQNTALTVMPPSATMSVYGNQRPQPVRLAVQSGGQPLEWHATTDAEWLRLIPSDGIAPAMIQLEAVTSELPPGAYTATVTISMEGVPNSPARIPIQLIIRR